MRSKMMCELSRSNEVGSGPKFQYYKDKIKSDANMAIFDLETAAINRANFVANLNWA